MSAFGAPRTRKSQGGRESEPEPIARVIGRRHLRSRTLRNAHAVFMVVAIDLCPRVCDGWTFCDLLSSWSPATAIASCQEKTAATRASHQPAQWSSSQWTPATSATRTGRWVRFGAKPPASTKNEESDQQEDDQAVPALSARAEKAHEDERLRNWPPPDGEGHLKTTRSSQDDAAFMLTPVHETGASDEETSSTAFTPVRAEQWAAETSGPVEVQCESPHRQELSPWRPSPIRSGSIATPKGGGYTPRGTCTSPSVYEPFGGSAGAAEETSAAASERELRFRAGATPEPGGGSRRVQSAAASPR